MHMHTEAEAKRRAEAMAHVRIEHALLSLFNSQRAVEPRFTVRAAHILRGSTAYPGIAPRLLQTAAMNAMHRNKKAANASQA
jgi:Trp operon repressor